MNEKLFYCVITVSLLLISCTKDAELVSKQYPVIQTKNVSSVDSNGVTFNGEFIDIGYSHITEYGFVFSTYEPSIDNSDTLIITSNATKGVFSKSISDNIAGNINYNVKAYAKTDNHVIYGNSIEFFSQGSKSNPWDLILQPNMDGWHDAHGASNNELGFVLFQSEDFYSYNPNTNTLVKKQNIPIDGNTGTYYASFNLDNYLYILTNDSKEILRYDIDNNQWIKLGDRPFSPNGYIGFFGFSINNIGYFLSRDNFYSYNQSTETWSKKLDIPSDYIYSAEVIGNKVYVFADNREIWMYDPNNDSWEKETEYPGKWKKKIISLAVQDNLYFGLSYDGYEHDEGAAQDFWRYSVSSKSWERIGNFPIKHSQMELFTYSIGNYGYIGFDTSRDGYNIWKFSEEKLRE